MIPVAPVPEPAGWQETRRKGERWLELNPASGGPRRPRNYWSAFVAELGEGFGWLCGYTATYLENGTVDHFVPWEELVGTKEEWRAYDWENLRFCAGWFNSARKCTPVPDPFLVQPGWFRLNLPSLQLDATDLVPKSEAERVQNVLVWLKNDLRVMRGRRKWYALYREGKISLEGLDAVAPMIAEALRRQPEYQVEPTRSAPRTRRART